jgi:hypothetical protein
MIVFSGFKNWGSLQVGSVSAERSIVLVVENGGVSRLFLRGFSFSSLV